jgi:hypothetical protein
MSIAIKPGTSGAARVEYYACREDVEALLVQGHTARAIYKHMKGQGRVTCSYSAFCDYVRGNGKRKHSTDRRKRQAQHQPAAPALQQSGPRIVRLESKRFIEPSQIDPKTLF